MAPQDMPAAENVPATEQLAIGAARLGLSLNQRQLQQFDQYLTLLRAWNERINLVASSQTAEIVQRHFLDSMTCALVTGTLEGRLLVDVGAGAGFPGIPLKIALPGLRLTLVESVTKKARFLQAVVDHLDLDDVQVLIARAEEVGRRPEYRDRFDWSVGRAVADLRILVEYLLPLTRIGGHALALKGTRAATEVQAAGRAIGELGGGATRLHTVMPGNGQRQNYLVVVDKVAQSPPRYPRRTGIPSKRPL